MRTVAFGADRPVRTRHTAQPASWLFRIFQLSVCATVSPAMSLNPFAEPFEPDHRTVVERRGDQVVVRKTGTSPAARHRLAHEAAVLARARRPGVVELVDHHDDGQEATLVTAWVGAHTLATMTVRSVDQVAGLVAVLADTVEALHLLG